MCAGVLLHRFATIDMYDLHGRGRELPIVGVLMGAGALLLAALPPFTTFQGKSLLEEAAVGVPGYGWLVAVFIVASAVTGGSVLRVAGSVFLGWGAEEGPHREQARAAEEEVDEERDPRGHTPVMMLLVPGVLLAGALALGLIPGAVDGVSRLAAGFVDHGSYGAWVLHGRSVPLPHVPPSSPSAEDYGYGALSVCGALVTAAVGLWGYRLKRLRTSSAAAWVRAPVEVLRGLHSGHIGDYIAWWSLGVSVIGGVCLIALH
jgi:multicomponent Na+:H+ antiporter subunit D